MDAHKIFTSVVKGLNFFTNVVEAYYKTGDNSAIELSIMGVRNTYISNGTALEGMIGVTVVTNGKMDKDKCTCFQDMDEALKYINSFNPIHKVMFVRYNAYGDRRKQITKL